MSLSTPLSGAAMIRKKAGKLLNRAVGFYEKWAEKAAANPDWAGENPIRITVSKSGGAGAGFMIIFATGGAAMETENSLRAFCQRQNRPELLAEWDAVKNAPLTPETVHKGSHRRVWWRCSSGHSWQAEVQRRTFRESKCPFCANRLLWTGSNDLGTVRPDLAAQWDFEKNSPLTPGDVLANSKKAVWWKCGKGHSWRAGILSRVRGSGCPACSRKIAVPGENDLETLFPELAAQWNRERNGDLLPSRVAAYSNKKVWWRCALGHEWQAVAAARASGAGCPYCAGKRVLAGFNDLATLCPEIAAQWDPSLNGALTPEMVMPGSHQKVWWRCPEGHVWKAAVFSRTGKQKCGCPVCAGNVRREKGAVS